MDVYCVFWRSGLDYNHKDLFHPIAICGSVERCKALIDTHAEEINLSGTDDSFSGDSYTFIGTRKEWIDSQCRYNIQFIIEQVGINCLFPEDLRRMY